LWLFWLLVIISASTVFYNRVFEPLASQVSRTYAERCGSGGNSETEPLVQSPQQVHTPHCVCGYLCLSALVRREGTQFSSKTFVCGVIE